MSSCIVTLPNVIARKSSSSLKPVTIISPLATSSLNEAHPGLISPLPKLNHLIYEIIDNAGLDYFNNTQYLDNESHLTAKMKNALFNYEISHTLRGAYNATVRILASSEIIWVGRCR